MKNTILYILSIIVLAFNTSCNNDDPTPTNLKSYLNSKSNKIDDVIACAASSEDEKQTLVYFYPRPNTSNFRLYLANSSEILKTDTENYTLQNIEDKSAIGNTLRVFTINSEQQQVWAIVSFEENNQISYSNPINLKHISSPTIYNDDIIITKNENPSFEWENILGKDNTTNAIFFEVINNNQNQLISGTYTLEPKYEYLNNQNVVLIITPENTTKLNPSEDYEFLVLGVSEDNWVNFISTTSFRL